MSLAEALRGKSKLQRQNGTTNLLLGRVKGDTLKESSNQRVGLPTRAFKVESKTTFEIFTDSPDGAENNPDTNIIHQLERRALESETRKPAKQPQNKGLHNVTNKNYGLSPSVSATSVYEDALSTVFESLPQHSPRSTLTQETCTSLSLNTEEKLGDNLEEFSDLTIDDLEFDADVYKYMQLREEKMKTDSRHLNLQPEITDNMRYRLVEWMSGVCADYNLCLQTFALSVGLVDRLFSCRKIQKKMLQLVGATCLLIASKVEEIYFPDVKEFIWSTGDAFSDNDMRKMERIILNTLDHDINLATTNWFASRLCYLCKLSKKVEALTSYLVELSLLQTHFLEFLPSVIGASAVHMATVMLDGVALEDDQVARKAQIEQEDIVTVCHLLATAFGVADESSEKTVYNKYLEPEYYRVAELELPASLREVPDSN